LSPESKTTVPSDALVGNGTVLPGRLFDRRERWVVALIFLLAITIAFPQIVFFGRSLVPTDNYNPIDGNFSAVNYGPDFIPAKEWSSRGLVQYTNLHDPGGSWWQGEPALQFFHHAISSGQLPFWDPSAACGAPVYCNLTSEFLFPPQILLCLAGATSLAKNIYILLLFWVAGFTTYCLLRLHGLAPLASFAGGLVFMFSGAVQQIGPSIFMGQAVACMPLLVLVTRWFLDQATWRRAAALGGSYAFAALASFPPILFAAFGFTIFYFLCSIILERPPRWPRLVMRYAAGVALSLGIVAVYYVPVFLTMRATTYATEWYRSAWEDILLPRALFGLFSPSAAGGALVYATPIITEVTGHLYYVGATALLLAGAALGRSTPRARALLVACSAAVPLLLMKVFGIPPIHGLGKLPVLQSIHYAQYFGIPVAFLLALLAAIGLDRLLRGVVRITNLAIVICLLGLAIGVLWFVAKDMRALQHQDAWRWLTDYVLVIVFAAFASVFASWTMVRSVAPRAATIAAGLLVALTFIEGVFNATYPRQRRWDVFAHPPPYISHLRGMEPKPRLFVEAALNANLGSAFDVDELDSLYMFSPPRMYDLYQEYAKSASQITMRSATVIPPDLVLARAGIGFLLFPPQHPLFTTVLKRHYWTVYNDAVRIFSRGPTPRFFFSSDYQVADHASALHLIATEPLEKVILESKPSFSPTPNQSDDPQPAALALKLNFQDFKLQAPRPGLLYIADAFDDGWSATVNGKKSKILTANYGFRAIVVPAGEVRVKLSYLPSGFIPGLIVSLLSLGIALGLFFWRPRLIAEPDAGAMATS
jgi:hypothetical protein